MAKPAYENDLYTTTLCQINRVLPLEYAIRAMKVSVPVIYQAMVSIDQSINECWRQKNFKDEEIIGNELKDMTWDMLQTGKIHTRPVNTVYPKDVYDDIIQGLIEIGNEFKDEVRSIHLPSKVNMFRYSDLMDGNDIPRMIVKVNQICSIVKDYDKESTIPLKYFPNFRIPVLLFDGCIISDVETIQSGDGRKFDNAVMLVLPIDKKLVNFKEMLNQFFWTYSTSSPPILF